MRALLGAGAAAAAALVLGGTALPSGAARGGAGGPLVTTASLAPARALYAAEVTAQVDVVYDPAHVDAGSIRVLPSFAPFEQVGATQTSRVQTPAGPVVRYRYTLVCLTDACVPTGTERKVRLKAVEVTARVDRGTASARAAWPAEVIVSRLSPADRRGTVRFRDPSTVPAPRYSLRPGTAAAALLAFAGLCAASALWLLVRPLRPEARRARRPGPGRLELALAYVRDSARRPDPADRRKALELLAEAVGDEGRPELARTTASAAWVEEPPTPAGAVRLADEAESAAERSAQ